MRTQISSVVSQAGRCPQSFLSALPECSKPVLHRCVGPASIFSSKYLTADSACVDIERSLACDHSFTNLFNCLHRYGATVSYLDLDTLRNDTLTTCIPPLFRRVQHTPVPPRRRNNVERWPTRAASAQTSTRPCTMARCIGKDF